MILENLVPLSPLSKKFKFRVVNIQKQNKKSEKHRKVNDLRCFFMCYEY